jgi:hypothetical protein
MRTDEIPVAHTPAGGYGSEMPPPLLAGCTDPLVEQAPDMRGLWRAVAIEWKMGSPPDPDPMVDHVERIEQCGDRVCITSTGIIHDTRADGTLENGVHDVTPQGQPITVRCTFENGVHVLRPEDLPGVEVTRHLEGDQLVWNYGPMFVARLERIS